MLLSVEQFEPNRRYGGICLCWWAFTLTAHCISNTHLPTFSIHFFARSIHSICIVYRKIRIYLYIIDWLLEYCKGWTNSSKYWHKNWLEIVYIHTYNRVPNFRWLNETKFIVTILLTVVIRPEDELSYQWMHTIHQRQSNRAIEKKGK